MDDSILRIAVRDDDKGDREKVCDLVKEYLDEKKVIAQIIFATSESSYALESFDVNPINYILKPIEKEVYYKAVSHGCNHASGEYYCWPVD